MTTTTTFTPAKRGDIVLVKARSSYSSLRDGYQSSTHWFFAKVTNVTRDGHVKGYQSHGDARPHLGQPMECVVCSQDKLRGRSADNVLAALPLDYPDAHHWPKEFPTVDAARAALLDVLGA